MMFVKVALLVSLIVGISECAGDRKAFQRHNRRLERFGCREPQPRVWEPEELRSEELRDLVKRGLKHAIKPPVTVLHRCQHTGCCKNPEQRCVAKKAEEVTLTFMVALNSLSFLEVQEKNHTQCICRLPDDSDIK